RRGVESRGTDATETTNEQTTTPDIWTEMKELRDMVHNLGTIVVEQREKLRNMEVRLTTNEAESQRPAVYNDLRKDSTSESQVRELSRAAAVISFYRFLSCVPVMPKVAFSAGLSHNGPVGPFNSVTTLVYTTILKRVCKMFLSSAPGNSTPPVRGVYYLRFTAMNNFSIAFRKYSHPYTFSTSCCVTHISNAFTLELMKGLYTVYMRNPTLWKLWDSYENHNPFSGFLLFTV
uniref:Uncharacterized protein n=1 Tax=Hucho hucho TaxID=62062 RepID=A0A4W5QI18_9TELE